MATAPEPARKPQPDNDSEDSGRVRAITYTRVSTDEQALSGLGLEAQQTAINTAIDTRGWDVVAALSDDGASGKDLNRPALTQALTMLAAGEADALVVAKLDRLSRSVNKFSGLMEQAASEGWSIVCLDIGVDTSTATGEFTAHMISAVSHHERRLISDRTKAALAIKKAQGHRLGRPTECPQTSRELVAELRAQGLSMAKIAEQLNTDQIPTARGGRWYASTVKSVLDGLDLDAQAIEAGHTSMGMSAS